MKIIIKPNILKTILFLFFVLIPDFIFGQTNLPKTEKVYTLGVVPQFDSLKLQEIWKPILVELTKKTGVRFSMRGSPTIPVFEKEFLKGDFDFIYFNPFHILLASQAQGYIPLVNDNVKKLYGILVVRKDNPIQSVKDLDGKVVAFPAPNAMGASLMIRSELKNRYNIKFKPTYVQTHSSVYLNVVLGEASAGGGVQKTLERQDSEVKNNLKILFRTQGVPSHPIAAHPRVPVEVRNKIREAFLALGKTKAGKELLEKIPIKQIGPISMREFLSVKELKLKQFYIEN